MHVSRPSTEFLSGGGEMGAQMRAKDWSATPLGPPNTWPQSLKTVVRIMLDSRYAMWMGWGPDLTFFYNDAYGRDTLGKKHPWALGRSAREVWAEIWADIGPRIDHVLTSGEATWDSGLLLFLERNGYPEETYHTFSYSPLYDDDSRMGGMLCVVTEETERIIAERRVALLRDLAAASTNIKSEQDVFDALSRSVPVNSRDLPFTLTYLFDSGGDTARFVSCTGIEPSNTAAASEAAAIWPLQRVLDENAAFVLETLPSRFEAYFTGPSIAATQMALVVPIPHQGQARPAGFFVAGLNQHRPLDEGYRGFVNLFVGQIASALANANAYAEERRRAEALAEIDRAKTAFFSNVSHEFRTPLTLMLGPLEDVISRRDEMPGAAIKELATVHRNGLRLLKLVNALLDFSRIEAGRVQAVFEPVDLGRYTGELASIFRSAVEKAGLRFVVDCPALPDPVYIDREMWEKIVLNLLSNAFKFTLEGQISVSLRPAGDHVELSIADTGCGVPAHELPRLFERFHRVEGTKGRTHEGTGIGLALVQELIKIHGGSVHAESRVAEGTTFSVRVPLGTAHLPQDRLTGARPGAAAAMGPSPFVEEALRWLPDESYDPSHFDGTADRTSNESSSGHRRRVVLADDNADMREYVKRLLSARGFLVEAVGDGEAALEAVRRQAPAVVLTDVMMPKLDGFGLLRSLRNDPSLAGIPVIMLSARAGEEATVEGLEAGADDYVIKPFSAKELIAKIEGRLALAEARRDIHRQIAQFETLLNEAPLGVYFVDSDFRIGQVNPTARAVFGDIPDLIGRDFDEVIHILWPQEYADEVVRLFKHTLETGEQYVTPERTAERRDRRVVEYYAWQISRIPLPDGRYGVVCYFQDVSVYVLARQALAESEARFRTFFDQGTYFAGVMSLDGTLLEANRLCLDACGFTHGEVVGRKFWDCGWWNRSPALVELVRAGSMQAAQGRLFREETRYFTADGSERFVDLTIAPVTDDAGNVLFVAPTGTDITDRKRLADEREHLLDAERAARSQAERASRLKEDFLATLSHELRTPLNAIMGWAQLIERGRHDSATLVEGVSVIYRNARAQLQMIEDMLDMGRISSGKLRLEVEGVDFSDVIGSSIESLRPAADAREIRLIKVLSSIRTIVSGDPHRLQQVVWNLLSNAIKFTPKGGRVQVTLERVNSHVELSVTDTGHGISSDFLPYVFERFRQADSSTKRSFGGLGLGLAIVKQLVELHGGTVQATSPGEGLGATFKVILPLAVAHADAQKSAPGDATPDNSESSARIALDGIRVLIVDDETDSRMLVKRILESSNAIPLTAGSAAEAMGHVVKARPHVIVSDIGMPGEDGYEFMRRVRGLRPDDGGQTPAVALTAYARPQDRRQALLAGYQSHVVKPVDPAELVTVVASLAGKLDYSPTGPTVR